METKTAPQIKPRQGRLGTTNPLSRRVLRSSVRQSKRVQRELKDVFTRSMELAGNLGFADTNTFRTWTSSDKCRPFYQTYRELRAADPKSYNGVRKPTLFAILQRHEVQEKDYLGENPDTEGWEPVDFIARAILQIMDANKGEEGVRAAPVLGPIPNDLPNEPYWRVWETIKFLNRQKNRATKKDTNSAAKVPDHVTAYLAWADEPVRGSDDIATSDVEMAEHQEFQDGHLFRPYKWQIYWSNRDSARDSGDKSQYWPEQVMPLMDPELCESPPHFRDKIAQTFNLIRLNQKIASVQARIQPVIPPNAYQDTVNLEVAYSWDQILDYCEQEEPARITWLLETITVPEGIARYETDIPLGVDKWLETRDGLIQEKVPYDGDGGPLSRSQRSQSRPPNQTEDFLSMGLEYLQSPASPNVNNSSNNPIVVPAEDESSPDVNIKDMVRTFLKDVDEDEEETNQEDEDMPELWPDEYDAVWPPGTSGAPEERVQDEPLHSHNTVIIYPEVDINTEGIDLNNRDLVRRIQAESLLALRNDRDLVQPPVKQEMTLEEQERITAITSLANLTDAASDVNITTKIDEQKFWAFEKIKVKADDVYDYGQSCEKLGLDPTAPAIPGMENCVMKPWQVTGTAFLGLRERGEDAPTPPSSESADKDSQPKLGPLGFQSIKTEGGIVACDTGLGKTLMMLSHIQYQYNIHEADRPYKPTMIIVPPSLIPTWVETAQKHFPNLIVRVYHGSNSTPEGKDLRAVRVMENDIALFERNDDGTVNVTKVLKKYQYLFNTNDAKAGRTVFITTYKTWEQRSLIWGPPIADERTGEMMRSLEGSRFARVFGRVILDEGHMAKNSATNTSLSIKSLEADLCWIVTATPMINAKEDLVGLLRLLWKEEWETGLSPRQKRAISAEGYDIYENWPVDPLDPKRLLALSPKRVMKMMGRDPDDLEPLRKHLPKIMELVQLRRSMATIVKNEAGSDFPIAHDIKPYVIETVELQHTAEEEVEYQAFHKAQAGIFLAKRRGSSKNQDKGRKSFNFPMQQWRRLCHMTSSVRLERLYHRRFRDTIGGEGKGVDGTLIKEVQEWRRQGNDYRFFVDESMLDADPKPETKGDYLKAMCFGSPKLRYLCDLVREIVVKQNRKLLIFVEWPLVQLYLEEFFKALYFRVASLNSDLTTPQKAQIATVFRDPQNDNESNDKSIELLFCSYRVSALGLNLQDDCNHCCLFEPAINTNTEVQAHGRLRRLGQKKFQYIYRLYIINSFSAYQEYKLMEKMKGEISGWVGDSRNAVMLDLINEASDFMLDEDALDDPDVFALGVQLIHQRMMGQKTSRATGRGLHINYAALDAHELRVEEDERKALEGRSLEPEDEPDVEMRDADNILNPLDTPPSEPREGEDKEEKDGEGKEHKGKDDEEDDEGKENEEEEDAEEEAGEEEA